MPHRGTIVQIAGLTIIVCHDEGGMEYAHDVAPDAVVTLNGQLSEIELLDPGDRVFLSGGPEAKTVAATR